MTRRTTPDPAEALARHLMTDGSGIERPLLMNVQLDKEYGGWTKKDLVKTIRKFYPPQKPKRSRRAKNA